MGPLGDLPLALFQENFKAIIQAETFLFKERGFKDQATYDLHWKNFYQSSCRYYSHLDKIQMEWGQYITGQSRFKNLFTRNKSLQLYQELDENKVVAGFSDTFHELNLTLSIKRQSSTIREASCCFLRVPDVVCSEAKDYLKNLEGAGIKGLNKKQVAHMLGGSQGCVHAIDLCHDALNLARGG